MSYLCLNCRHVTEPLDGLNACPSCGDRGIPADTTLTQTVTITDHELPRPRKPIVHGDRKGYQAHRRRGEEPCEDCKVGNRRDQAKYRKPSTRKKPDLKATTSPKTRDISREPARTSAKKPNGAWVQTDEGRSIARDISRDNGANPIGRYLNLLLTLAESQEVPDPALLDKIDKLIGIAL